MMWSIEFCFIGGIIESSSPGDRFDGYHVPITQSELADLIGATRETTSTTLNQLEKRGLLKLSRRLLTIPSPGLLRTATAQMQGAIAAKAGYLSCLVG